MSWARSTKRTLKVALGMFQQVENLKITAEKSKHVSEQGPLQTHLFVPMSHIYSELWVTCALNLF